MPTIKPRNIPYLVAIGFGVSYGAVCQFAIRLKMFKELWGAMSFGFVFILPFILGFVTLWFATPKEREGWLFRIFAPWGTIGTSLVVSLIVGWEGAICMITAAIVFLPLSSLGGIVSGLILSRYDRNKVSSGIFATLLLLPFISAYTESFYDLPVRHDGALTSIDIDAPPSVVWSNITRIKPIHEPLDGFFYRMGFPKPVEATLSHEGVGGVRHASFERGLVFVETIDQWEPERLLSFTIDVDPNSIPTTTLDEHVAVGGRYFDVLRGTYQILPLNGKKVRLILSSQFTVSTRFNFYAGLWANFLMSDIQQTILKVIKQRCELEARQAGHS